MPLPATHDLHHILERLFHLDGFRPGQMEVIERVLANENLLVVMPTGAGKSLCYQMPAALLPGCTLVVSPLIALMKDQRDGLPPVLARRATVLNSSVSGTETERRLRSIAEGETRLVFAAPERFRQLPFLYHLARAKLSLFVVDEAHCVDQWGDDFRPDYAALGQAIQMLGRPPVLALTATASPTTAARIEAALGVALEKRLYGVCRTNLRLEVVPCPTEESRTTRLVRFCQARRGERGLVYTASRLRAEKIAALLHRQGVEAAHYHAGMEPDYRAALHTRFQAGTLRVLVATVAFGLGIDIPDIRFLVHFDAPDSLEAYAQEAGRAGRDGLPARCVCFTVPVPEEAEHPALTIPQMQKVYAAVGQALEGRLDMPGLVMMDDLRRETEMEATPIRVALASLERAGMLRRHLDLPVSVSVRRGRSLPDEAAVPPQLPHLLTTFCPAGGGWNDAPTDSLAEELGIALPDIESFLLACQSEGWVQYRGSQRSMVWERTRLTAAEARSRRQGLESELRWYEEERARRRQAMQDFLLTTQCRHHFLANYFGQDTAATCAVCDNCRPIHEDWHGTNETAPPAESPGTVPTAVQTDAALNRLLLRCVASLPFPMGRSGVINLLRGEGERAQTTLRSPYHSLLKEMPATRILTTLDRLLEEGLLHIRQDGTYPILVLTPTGARAAREFPTDETP